MTSLRAVPALALLVLVASARAPAFEIDALPDQIVPHHALVSEETGEIVFDAAVENATSIDAAAEAPYARERVLAAESEKLARLARKTYVAIQKKTVGSTFPACNFFLITGLCKSGYCADGKPFFKAANFDGYFRSHGWKEITVAELKTWLQVGTDFDGVLQRDGSKGRGHVMVPIGVTADGKIRFAQGNHGKATNEIVSWSAASVIKQRFRVFVKL